MPTFTERIELGHVADGLPPGYQEGVRCARGAWWFGVSLVLACGATDDPAPPAEPTRLSETGLYADVAARTVAADVLPYAPASPLFSDGDEKHRWLSIPRGASVDTSDPDRWVFPVGTKAWKEFRVSGRLVETRLFVKREAGRGMSAWKAYAFVWTPDGRDAVATPEGVSSVPGTAHEVPSEEDCAFCHSNVADGLIGVSAVQLSKLRQGEASPLAGFVARGWLREPPRDFAVPGTAVEQAALGYLDGNCGFCHNDESSLRAYSPMRLRLRLGDGSVAQTGAYTTTFGTRMRHKLGDGVDVAIVPGQPERSQIYLRLTAADRTRMPPRGPKLLDPDGDASVRAWIASLP